MRRHGALPSPRASGRPGTLHPTGGDRRARSCPSRRVQPPGMRRGAPASRCAGSRTLRRTAPSGVQRGEEGEDRRRLRVGRGKYARQIWRVDLVVGKATSEHQVFEPEHVGHRVILRVPGRDALERIVALDRAELGEERRVLQRGADPRLIGDDRVAEGVQSRLCRLPHAPAGKVVAGLEMKVRAVRVLRVRDLAVGSHVRDPRERGAQVRLVGGFVLREAGVPVDPKDRPLGIRLQRQPELVESVSEARDELLHGLLEEPLVFRLAGLEPRAVVVLGELRQEVDGLRSEACETADGDGHDDLHAALAAIVRGLAHLPVIGDFTATILRAVGAKRVPDPAAAATEVAAATELAAALVGWYRVNGRDLAFRRRSDPYAVLVSEAMAQQTQADRAAAYWERFMTRFPSVDALAQATPADVLREWQGLGYNRLSLALWRAARTIRDDYGGRVPDSIEELERLPGVGP